MKRTIIRIILSLVIIVVGFITYRIVSCSALEKYTVSNNGQSITNKSGQEYVSDTYLEAISLGKEIGKTDDGGSVYEIKGQPEHDWVAFNMTSEMTITQIFHKKQIEQFSISNKSIAKIRLLENKGLRQAFGISVASTTEQTILEELNNTLGDTGKTQKINSDNIVSLQILFDGYKGIAYVNYAIITDKHEVYMSGVNDDNLIKAGPLLSKWVLDNAPK